MSVNNCVCCGEIIPDGRMVCLVCENQTALIKAQNRHIYGEGNVMEYYGMAKKHNTKSQEIYDFISKLDLECGDMFCFKSGGDGDNGECLMDLLDVYFLAQQRDEV